MTYFQKKKHLLFYIVGKIKGFVRTVIGIPPLTLPDCVDADSIINYTIDGNSVQDGTPTPENPVEVESVGEKTINLFPSGEEKTIISNGIEFISDGKGTYTIHGTSTSPAIATFNLNEEFTFPISVSNGGTGVLHFNNDTANNNAVINFYKDDVKVDSWTIAPSMRISSGYVALGGKVCNQIRLYISANTTVNMTLSPMVVNNIVEPTPFEPFGYKIPVKCGQLLDYITYKRGYFINSSGVEEAQGGYKCTEDYIPVLPNTKYRIVCENGKTVADFYLTMPFYDSNKKFISRNAFGTFAEVPKIREFTTPNNCYYIRFSLPNAYDYDVSLYNLDNTTNIYLDEPLRKVGSAADYIDFENQKIIRQVGKWMFTDYNTSGYLDHYSARMSDTQAWTTCCVAIPFKNMAVGHANKFVSHFKRGSNGQAYSWKIATHGIYGGHSEYNNIYINLGDSKTLYNASDNRITNWEHWNEAYVVGELETPTETAIELPKLSTIKGTTIYSIDTQIQPSNMSATYYSTAKE